MKRKILWLCAVAASIYTSPLMSANTLDNANGEAALSLSPSALSSPAGAQTANGSEPVIIEQAPSRNVTLSFAQIAPAPGNIALKGIIPDARVTFDTRRDEVVSRAVLNLEYTPSPALLPVQSQLKVYLNDELMGVLPVTKEQLGQKTAAQMPIDPRYIADFNTIRLEFLGHYRDICENPTNNALWLDIGRNSSLNVNYQSLLLKNDLSYFPEPFFDAHDSRVLTLPMIFPRTPSLKQQEAAGIIASWFGTKAQWRGQQFPVLYNQLPKNNAIVFATNEARPDFLRNYPTVTRPTIEMVSHPQDPYLKLLVVFGRDDNDLVQAAKGIAQGNLLFRGSSVTVDEVKAIIPRQPYDAPNWVPTDRPVSLGELKTYPQQLQSTGIVPRPLNIDVNLPPDLFIARSDGIDLDLKYRYTAPVEKDSSRLAISLNDKFVQSINLTPKETGNQLLRLPVIQGLLDDKTDVAIPALQLASRNQLSFDFSYMNPMPGGTLENCITYQPVPNHVVIEDSSTLNFSSYYHFIAMPDLRVFANSGFPFSRMADLSQTLIVVSQNPQPGQVTTLLDTLGMVGAQTGFPALNVTLTDDGQSIKDKDADIMIIGSIPPELKDDKQITLLVNATESWVKTPLRQTPLLNSQPDAKFSEAETQTTISSSGPMAAILGFQSPYNSQRSVLALLADSPRGNELLNEAIGDSGKRAFIGGSVTIIRDSGVNALRVGDVYYVGHLPWYERVWFALSAHPVILSILAVVTMVVLGWILWRVLHILSRRRLNKGDK